MATIRNIMVRVGGDVSQMVQAFRRGQQQARKFQNTFKDFGQSTTEAGKKLTTSITAPIVGLGVVSVANSAKFERSMSAVSAVTKETGKGLDDLSNKAREMGSKTSKSAIEASEAMQYMGLAGWDNKQILEGIEPVLRLAEAGNLDLARASDLVTDSMAAFGIKTKDLKVYLDDVAEASRSSNTNIDMIAEAMIKAGGQFRNLKTPLSEASTLIGVMANRGQKGAEAGTALNSILINLTAGAGQAKKAMKSINLEAYDAKGNFKGVSNVLKELNDKIKVLTPERRQKVLAGIGGKTQIDTLNNLLASVEEGTGEFDQLHKQIKNSDGSLMSMVKTMQGNFIGQLNILKSTLQEISLQFGDIILPYLKVFTEFVTKLAQKFGKLSEPIKKFIVVFAIIGAIIPPLVLGFGLFVTAISSIAGVIAGITMPIIALVAGFALIIGAIIGFVAFVIEAYKNNESFRESVNNLGEAIKTKFEQAKEKVTMLKEKFLAFWEENKKPIMEFKNKITEVISTIVKIVTSFITGDMEKFKKDSGALFDKVFELWLIAQTKLKPILDKLIKKVVSKLGKLVFEGLKYAGAFMIGFISTIAKKATLLMLVIRASIINKVKTKLRELYLIAFTAGSIFIGYLISGLNSRIKTLKAKISGIVNTIARFFPQSPAKEGALKHIPNWGKKIIDQLGDSLTKNSSSLKKTVSKLSSGLVIEGNVKMKKNAIAMLIKDFNKIEKEAKKSTDVSNKVKDLNKKISELYGDKKEKGISKDRIKDINKEILKLKKEISSVKAEGKQNFLKTFSENSKEYLDKLNNELKSSINNVKSVINKYFDSYSLFERVQTKNLSGGKLLNNLKTQVSAMKEYQRLMGELNKKNVSEKLKEKFMNLGLGGLNELIAINRLSDEQLKNYSDLVSKKYALSEELAINEINQNELQDKRIEKLIFNITGNNIVGEDSTRELANDIVKYLKFEGI